MILIRVGLRNLRVRRKVSKVSKVLCFFIRLLIVNFRLIVFSAFDVYRRGGEIFSSQRDLECALLLNWSLLNKELRDIYTNSRGAIRVAAQVTTRRTIGYSKYKLIMNLYDITSYISYGFKTVKDLRRLRDLRRLKGFTNQGTVPIGRNLFVLRGFLL